jgi:hypothetical protein
MKDAFEKPMFHTPFLEEGPVMCSTYGFKLQN